MGTILYKSHMFDKNISCKLLSWAFTARFLSNKSDVIIMGTAIPIGEQRVKHSNQSIVKQTEITLMFLYFIHLTDKLE